MKIRGTQGHVKLGQFTIYPSGAAQIDMIIHLQGANQSWDIELGFNNPNWTRDENENPVYKPIAEQVKPENELDCYKITEVTDQETDEELFLNQNEKNELKIHLFELLGGEIGLVRSAKESNMLYYFSLPEEKKDSLSKEEKEKIFSDEPLVF